MMAAPESVPATVLALVKACGQCESERHPRMFICSYHEGWWGCWDVVTAVPIDLHLIADCLPYSGAGIDEATALIDHLADHGYHIVQIAR